VIQAPLGWLQVTPKGRPRRQTVGPAGNESERILEPHQETTRVLWIVPFSLSDTIEPQNPGCFLMGFSAEDSSPQNTHRVSEERLRQSFNFKSFRHQQPLIQMPACSLPGSIIDAMLAGRYPQVRNELRTSSASSLLSLMLSPAATFSRVEFKSRNRTQRISVTEIVSATVTVDRSQPG